jgi:hypothetical protein
MSGTRATQLRVEYARGYLGLALFAEAAAELGHALVTHRLDVLVGELFARNVANFNSWIQAQRIVADCVQEVGFTQARVPIDKQRVVGLGRGFGNRKRGRVGESVRGSGDEVVKVVLGVQFVVVPSAR